MPNTAKLNADRNTRVTANLSLFQAYISRAREIMLLAVSSVSRDMQLIYSVHIQAKSKNEAMYVYME